MGFTDLDQCPCGSSLGMIGEVCEYGMRRRRPSTTASAGYGEEDLRRRVLCLGEAVRRASRGGGGWLPWRVPNGAMGSENKLGTTTEVRDNNGDTTSGIKAEGRVRDRVGDGDDTTSRELVV
jgi:hypothetical protein